MENSHDFRLLLTGAIFLLLAALAIVLLTSNALAASSIYGTVTDAETDDPIAEADVRIWDPEDRTNNHQTTTDGEGYYEVTVDPGHYEIKISKDGYETHSGEEDVGFEEQVEHNAELEPVEETYIEGYITEANSRAEGDPIEGANITVSDRKNKFTGSTDSEGYYNITCKEGEYTINITHEDYESHEERIQIRAGANRYNAGLTPSSGDGGDSNGGRGDDSGGGDDDGFEIVGSDGVMLAGWIVAAVLVAALVIQRKTSEPEE